MVKAENHFISKKSCLAVFQICLVIILPLTPFRTECKICITLPLKTISSDYSCLFMNFPRSPGTDDIWYTPSVTPCSWNLPCNNHSPSVAEDSGYLWPFVPFAVLTSSWLTLKISGSLHLCLQYDLPSHCSSTAYFHSHNKCLHLGYYIPRHSSFCIFLSAQVTHQVVSNISVDLMESSILFISYFQCFRHFLYIFFSPHPAPNIIQHLKYRFTSSLSWFATSSFYSPLARPQSWMKQNVHFLSVHTWAWWVLLKEYHDFHFCTVWLDYLDKFLLLKITKNAGYNIKKYSPVKHWRIKKIIRNYQTKLQGKLETQRSKLNLKSFAPEGTSWYFTEKLQNTK